RISPPRWIGCERPVRASATISSPASAASRSSSKTRPVTRSSCSSRSAPRRAWMPRGLSLKGLEGDNRIGVLDARHCLHLFIHEVPDIGAGIHVELHQEIVVASGRIDFGGDLGFGELIGHLIGLAELAFDLD